MENRGRGLERSERQRIAFEVWRQTGLTQKEVGQIVDRSKAWVSKAVDAGFAEEDPR